MSMEKQPIKKYIDLRKEYEVTAEQRIGDNKDQYIRYLETTVLAYREKFGGIDIIPKV
jgi:hypothetical protein